MIWSTIPILADLSNRGKDHWLGGKHITGTTILSTVEGRKRDKHTDSRAGAATDRRPQGEKND